ncbi:small multi-drug export protein [Gracilibacillus kekensis]|uniref:Putative small multi-drug export protein n=1 Tax=Gracilibacillus kekensis TaxID=1027249 RepID=A0A1M7QU68_9BACI|nr:small multi-drug export protein [Gracilibacillus kekensis]SHN34967.1 Putative small multi-drug export protein [Gracilibacillus kekensis]
MMNYIWLAATAWFMGFFPLFEIYLAVPASMGLGLDIVSSVFWSWLGNFMVIPFISYSYDWLTKFKKINKYFIKLANSKSSKKLNNGGFLIILIATPIFGSWATGVAGKIIGIDRKRLFLSSGISIAIYGMIISILTQLGIDTFS